jgi:anti-sigma-K factor RskA/sigma-70-like protein
VHESVGLLDPILDGHTGPGALLAGLDQLETEHPLERPIEGHRGRRSVGHRRQVTLPPAVPTFDKLSAEQRAIIELIIQRGQSYQGLAEMLAMPAPRVRELARDALSALAPVSASRVDGDWRGQIADHVLGQQSGPESVATRAHLKRSEEGRAWVRSLLDSLGDLYPPGKALPEIPEAEGEPARRPRRRLREPTPEPPVREERPARPPAGPLSPAAEAAVRRRRLIAAGAGLAVVVLAAVLLIAGVFGGGDDNGGKSTRASTTPTTSTQAPPDIVSEIVLKSLVKERGAGVAVVTRRAGRLQLVVQARGLKPNAQGEAYEVWLFNSRSDAKSIGAQVTDSQGNFQGAGPLPANYTRFKFIDISREKIDENAAHSGHSVLRGAFKQG